MPHLQPLDQIRNILAMAHLHASARLSLIHETLNVPKNKRGRKPTGQPPKNFDADYQRQRRERLKAEGKCSRCGTARKEAGFANCEECRKKDRRRRFNLDDTV